MTDDTHDPDAVCPMCEHDNLGPMAHLGTLTHYHCRSCGWWWSAPTEAIPCAS